MPKKSGKAKMTEAEKLILMEQQRLAEEEMRKTKETMLANFLTSKLNQEEKMSRFNLDKLNNQWRDIMREIKAKELRKEIEILSQTFERILDKKESILKSLTQDIREADEQFAMAFRSHLQNVDYLVDLQRQRIEQLNQEFMEEQELLLEEFEIEQLTLEEQHREEMRQLEDIIFAMEENFMEKEFDLRAEFQSNRDEIKNKNLEELHSMKVYKETKVAQIRDEMEAAYNKYQAITEDKQKAYNELEAKDRRSTRVIEMQMRKIERQLDEIANRKADIQSNSRRHKNKNSALKLERDQLLLNLKQLRSEISTTASASKSVLVDLTTVTHQVIKDLKQKVSKGEQILRYSEMCRKMETEQEKVLPFYQSTLEPDEQEELERLLKEQSFEPLVNEIDKYVDLENFWKRFNKVALEKLALEREKSALNNENLLLRQTLKKYLDGISVSDEVLTQHNTLLIVNNGVNRCDVSINDPRVKRKDQTKGCLIKPAPVTVKLTTNN